MPSASFSGLENHHGFPPFPLQVDKGTAGSLLRDTDRVRLPRSQTRDAQRGSCPATFGRPARRENCADATLLARRGNVSRQSRNPSWTQHTSTQTHRCVSLAGEINSRTGATTESRVPEEERNPHAVPTRRINTPRIPHCVTMSRARISGAYDQRPAPPCGVGLILTATVLRGGALRIVRRTGLLWSNV